MLKKKSKWYFNFKRSREGVILEIRTIEGSFGAINRKSEEYENVLGCSIFMGLFP